MKLPIVASVLAILLAGCATNNKPVHQRGWIGGNIKLAQRSTRVELFGSTGTINLFPNVLESTQKAGILIASLNSNTPAWSAGLREGDLILQLRNKPVTTLQEFRRSVDRNEPGTVLPIKAYRNGQTMDYSVAVGREKFRDGGRLTITFLPFVQPWNLWPNHYHPGFSLVVLGYQLNPGIREELYSVEETFLRRCSVSERHPYDEERKIWLAILEISNGKIILSQESVTLPQ